MGLVKIYKMITTSLIVPLFNEEKNIPSLIKMLINQTVYPNEIIFINAGSTDSTLTILKNEIDNTEILKNIIIIKDTEKLFPGAARNIGIQFSKFEYILFIDAGIIINDKWIEKAIIAMTDKKYDIVWGGCKFTYINNFSEALCAITFGKNKIYKTIPGSIINRKIFEIVGNFETNLLSAEDLLWMNKVSEHDISSTINDLNFNTYNSYPKNLISLSKKWFLNSFYSIKSKLYFKQAILYITFFIILFLSLLISLDYAIFLFLIYIIFRLIIFPIKKK